MSSCLLSFFLSFLFQYYGLLFSSNFLSLSLIIYSLPFPFSPVFITFFQLFSNHIFPSFLMLSSLILFSSLFTRFFFSGFIILYSIFLLFMLFISSFLSSFFSTISSCLSSTLRKSLSLSSLPLSHKSSILIQILLFFLFILLSVSSFFLLSS